MPERAEINRPRGESAGMCVAFVVLLLAAAACVVLLLRLNLGSRARMISLQEVSGEFILPDTIATDDMFFNLGGEWEFYPDELLLPGETPEKPPVILAVPGVWYGLPRESQPSEGCGTYRAVLRGVPENMALSIAGFYSDCRIFVNGTETYIRSESPRCYQVYWITASADVELLIQILDNASGGLTVCPKVSAPGKALSFLDSLRNTMLIVVTFFMCVAVLPVFSVNLRRDRHFRCLCLTELLLTLLLVTSMAWCFGYLDRIDSIIPLELFPGLIFFLSLAALQCALFTQWQRFPAVFGKRHRVATASLLGLAEILRVVFLRTFPWGGGMYLVWGCLAAVALLWLLRILANLRRAARSLMFSSVAILAVFTGVGCLVIDSLYTVNTRGGAMLIACMAVHLIYSLFLLFEQQEAQLKSARQLLELEKTVNKTQSALLASQIQPHFLYNTLTTIQEMCYTAPDEAAAMIVRFSEYLRQNIDFMDYTDLIPFSRELEHIRNFIFIQKARFGDALDFKEDITFGGFMIPPLVVQPLVENSVKYGVRRTKAGGTVALSALMARDGVHIRVVNDGPGFDPESISAQHSIANIRSRISSLLGGTLTIISSPGGDGTSAELFIPISEVKFDETGSP